MKNARWTVIVTVILIAASVTAADWPQWGSRPGRNMVNLTETGLPTDWDVASGRNIRWTMRLGSQGYGNPVIAGGRVYVGTNNEGKYDPEVVGDRGNILCFKESDGTFLWQAIHDKLPAGRVNDWPLQGICSTVWVEGDRVWYVNNRCELVCVDAEGFSDGENDGVQDEKYQGEQKADIVWSFDMIEELGVFPHNLATSSPLVYGNLVLVVTGNGVDEGHLNIPAQASPSFAAFDKETGELVWEAFVDDRILHGQWSSPSVGFVDGKAQAVFPGGDGWVYTFEPESGKFLWKFDLNPKDSVWELGGYGTKNNIIATPVFQDGRVYIGVGQDPEHGTGVGHLYCIDASGEGDATASKMVWHIGNADFGRTMSTVAVADGLVYVADLAGMFFCLDAATGKPLWTHDLKAAVWGSPMLVDGKVYIGDDDGDVTIFKHSREKQILNTVNMGQSVYTTPAPANGTLFVTTKSHIYAIAAE